MSTLLTPYAGLTFTEPNPEHDALVTLQWFESPNGRETLLLMGNAEHEIGVPSLEEELKTLQEFVDLRASNKQLTWMMQMNNKIIGVAWIELIHKHSVQPPSIHLMIGDKDYRGMGIGRATMEALIEYVKQNLHTRKIYSRHLKINTIVAALNQSLGFVEDGSPYLDNNGLEWQNIVLEIPGHDL